jgi:hypothetical protein
LPRDATDYAGPQSQQLRPIATQNVNQIQIQFNENVAKRGRNGIDVAIANTAADGNALLELKRTVRNPDGTVSDSTVSATSFSYNSTTFVGTWTFPTLGDGKFAIHLKAAKSGTAGVVNTVGFRLDGEYTNETNGTPDIFTDDPIRPFVVGNGVEGSSDNEEFRFHFALLVADFAGDGAVDGLDFERWQQLYGTSGPSVADANGDGLVNDDDFDIWAAIPSAFLPLRRLVGGDLIDDEIVNDIDFNSWIAGFGATGEGDLNYDGVTDGVDFLLWQSQASVGTKIAWYIEGTSSGASVAPVGDMDAPRVINVIISGSHSTHAPFAMSAVDGTGDQLRTVPVGGADTISITFSENVNVSGGSLMLVGLHLTTRPDLAEFSYDAVTYAATWRFEGWALADQYLMSLTDKVSDAYGNALDGEWVNPWNNWSQNAAISEFPSGDGTPGGMFNFVMTLLPGDANLDGLVNSTDLSILQANYGLEFDATFSAGDFDGDGDVDGSDTNQGQSTFGLNYQAIWIGCNLDGDLDVDDDDLDIFFDNVGMEDPTFQDGDFNFDGEIDVEDRDILLAQYMLHGSCGLFIDAVW